MSNAVATVAFLQGQAWAKSPDGSLRPLTVGAVLNDNEILVTAEGARVELDIGGVEALVINGGQEVAMSRDMNPQTATSADEALLDDASVQQVLAALEQEGDLLDELEETAAGDNAATGGGSNSFVRLDRIDEATDPLEFTYGQGDQPAPALVVNDFQQASASVDEPEVPVDPTPPVNSSPVSADQTLTVDEDAELNGQISATDLDGDTLTYALTTNPANGTLTLDPATGSFVYTPNTNYNGSDSFVVTISDGQGGTTTSTVTIGVTPVNDAPVSGDQSLTTDEDVALPGQIVATDVDGDTLTYALTTNPANGTLTLDPTTGSFVYTPNSNYNGSDSFVVTISDGQGGTTTSTVTIGVTPVNDAPVSADQTLTTDEDVALPGQIVATDVDGDTLAYAVSGAPTNGSVTLDPVTGSFIYTPNTNYNGSDSFVVTISDGNGGTTTSTVTIGVNPLNDVPFASDLSLTTDEDVAVPGQIVADDLDGDTLAYAVSGAPTNGSVNLDPVTGSFVYTPNANYNGSDSFVVTISDGNGGTTTSTVTIGVNPLNDVPVASDLSLTTDEDVAVPGQIVADDLDGDTLAYAVSGAPTNGSVNLDPVTGSFVYTPNTNYNGSDSFVVTISDGQGGTTTSTVTIGVTPVNDAPVSADQTLTTNEDVALPGQISATDVDGDTLTYALTTNPANGTLTLDPTTGSFVYTPNANYNGSDSFVVTISDGQGGTTTSTVTIGVTPVNDAPVSADQTLTTDEDVALPGQIVASDVDSDTLTYALTSNPANGTLTLDPTTGSFVYTPNTNYNGSDSFVVTISDGNGGTTTSTVTVGVTPVNDAPVSGDQSLTTDEDVPVNGAISANDPDGDALSYSVTGSPANGTVVLNPMTGTFVYTPNTNYNGSDSFVVTVSDGNGGTTTSTVNIGITPVDEVTVNSVTSPSVTEGSDLVYTVTLSGPVAGEASLSYSLGGGSAVAADYGNAIFSNGVTLVGGNLIVPNGVSSFTVTVPTVDDAIAEATETLPLNVGGVTGTGSILDNDPAPKILSIGVFHATEGSDLVCTVTFDQVLAVPYSLSYSIGGGTASPADYGTPVFSNGVTIVGGNLLIPEGINSFSVTLPTVDDTIDEPTERVPFTFGSLTLNGLIYDNDAAPSVSIDSINVNEADGTATFTVTLSAASGQPISVDYASSNGSATAGSDYTAVSGTLNFAVGETSKTITVSINDDSLFEGSEDFTITLSNPTNATLGTAVGIGTIVDNDPVPNQPSVMNPETVTVDEDFFVLGNVLSNDSDADDVLRIASYEVNGNTYLAGTNAIITGVGDITIFSTGDYRFTPEPNYHGPVPVITYTTNTGSSSTLTITVSPVNDAPIAVDDSFTTDEDTPLSIPIASLLGNDSDIDGDTVQFDSLGSAVGGTVVLVGTDVVFTPNLNFNGAATFTYTVSDGNGKFDTATVTVTVNPINDPSVMAPEVISIPEDNFVLGNVLANDSDVDDVLRIASYEVNGNTYLAGTNAIIAGVGDITIFSTGDYRFTPEPNYNGPVPVITYTTNTGSSSTLTITVDPVNDRPVAVDDSFTTTQGLSIDIPVADLLLNDTDIDLDTLSVDLVSGAVNGTVSISGGLVTFVPTPGFTGTASFTYRVTDGNLTDTATVTVNVVEANTPPVANDDNPVDPAVTANKGLHSEYFGYRQGTDGPNLASLEQVKAYIDGRVPSATFTATTLDYNSSNSFSNNLGRDTNLQIFLGSDAASLSTDPATTSDAIIRMSGFIELDAGTYNFRVLGDDGYQIKIDGVTVAEVATNQSATTRVHPSFTIATGGIHTIEIVYWDQGYYARFNAELSDDGGMTYQPFNSFNSYKTANLVATEDTPFTITAATLLANDSDVNNDGLTLHSVQGAVNGSVAIVDGNVVFTPNANYAGPASFTYTISDGRGGFDTASVNLVVSPVNDAPIAVNDNLIGASNSTLTITPATLRANDIDVDGNILQIVAVDNAVNGTVSINGAGNILFTPTPGFEGTASFTYTARDSDGLQASATAIVAVGSASAPSVVVSKSLVAIAQGIGGTSVAFPITTTLVDTDGSETLSIRVSGVPMGLSFNAGTNLGGGVWQFVEADLPNLMLNLPGAYTINSTNLTVQVTSTEINGGFTASTSATVNLKAAYTTVDVTTTESGNYTGNSANEHIQGGAGDNTINAGTGNNVIRGGAGNDTLIAGSGSDIIYGGTGDDKINAGSGNDRIYGGAGNDTLQGGNSGENFADVFVWSLGDQGVAGAPAVDTIQNFSTNAAGNNGTGGDVLDLRDLLQGEAVGPLNNAGNLTDYLHFEVSGGSTIVHISHTGGYAGGGFDSAQTSQQIVLSGVDLQSVYSGATTDQQIITQLLNNNKLITD